MFMIGLAGRTIGSMYIFAKSQLVFLVWNYYKHTQNCVLTCALLREYVFVFYFSRCSDVLWSEILNFALGSIRFHGKMSIWFGSEVVCVGCLF